MADLPVQPGDLPLPHPDRAGRHRRRARAPAAAVGRPVPGARLTAETFRGCADGDARARRVCAVTVTYGRRAHLVERVARATLPEGVGRLVIVLNGVTADGAERCRALAGADPRVVTLDLPRNAGSAVGFAAGIAEALAWPGTDACWLLDDDNVPRPGALASLLASQAWRTEGDDLTALLAYRPSLAYLRRSLAGGPAAYARPSAFMDFDLRKLLAPQRRRAAATSAGAVPASATIPYAPYGGLLVPRALLGRVGVPDPRFVVYADDSEFTARIPRAGGRIRLIRDSVVDDVEPSGLAATAGRRRPPRWDWFAIDEEWRAYYAMRNKIALDRERAHSLAVFAANGAVVTAWLALLGLVAWRPRRLAVMARALRDGLAGRLGETRRLPSG